MARNHLNRSEVNGRGKLRPERYENDDYSRYASNEYRETEYDRDYAGNYGTPEHPGVSGKSRDDDQWFNRGAYEEQRNFIGKGPKGYKRTDDRVYEEVCEALMRSHSVDASEIGVKVEGGMVTLEGKVSSRAEKRAAEMEIEDLPGVLDVRNELRLRGRESESKAEGPAEAVRKDLGVDSPLDKNVS